MSETIKNNLNNFIAEFPKADIIAILNNIDQDISALHNTSSKDFMYFNKLLKEYYARIKEISETNNQISTFFRNDLRDYTEKIKAKNQLQEKFLHNIDSNLTFLHEKLSHVYSAFDLLIVPFNNFKQNLIALKYILANLNLHLTYIDLKNKDELKTSANKLNQGITKVAASNEISSTKTEQLVQAIFQIKNNSTLLKSKGNANVIESISKLNVELKKQDNQDFWPDNFLHRLSMHSQNCFTNMGEIITNLQYHDIIRQKMEHIQTSQKELIDGLDKFSQREGSDLMEEQLKVITGIPEITEIQVAQLLYTNKDYQTSIEKITSKLIEVGREMKQLNSLYLELNNSSENFRASFLEHISDTQNTFNNFTEKYNSNWAGTSNDLENILSQYANFKNDFNDVFTEEKSIRSEIKNFEQLIVSNGKNFSADLMNRLNSLMADLKLNSNSLKNAINNITSLVNSLKSVSNELGTELNNYELNQINVDQFSQKLVQVETLCMTYAKTSLTMDSEITSSLKKIEYYKFFEKTVEDIVQKLNEINAKINYDYIKKEKLLDKSVLDKIEKLYTMKSERDIHHKLMDSGVSIADLINNDENTDVADDSDGDLELF